MTTSVGPAREDQLAVHRPSRRTGDNLQGKCLAGPHSCIVWPPASWTSDVCGAGAFDTSRVTTSSQGVWVIVLRAVIPWSISLDWRTLVVCTPMVES